MKKFITTLFVFGIPILLYCIIAVFTMPILLSKQNGPSTKDQITFSFNNAIKKDYEMLILGNSRIYRGLNPDKFLIKTYNFSHDNDSYNQLFYKLKFINEKGKKIKYLILGIDYFQFSFISDKRNYVYSDLLGDDYNRDYSSTAFFDKLNYHIGNMNPKKIMDLRTKNDIPFIRENGQYIKHGIAKENDTIKRNIFRLPFQEKYFTKILELCKKDKIKTFIVMPPVRNKELLSYSLSEIQKFDSYINSFTDNKRVFYLNFSNSIDFDISDYTDITHLNEKAANRFSEKLNDTIQNLLKIN